MRREPKRVLGLQERARAPLSRRDFGDKEESPETWQEIREAATGPREERQVRHHALTNSFRVLQSRQSVYAAGARRGASVLSPCLQLCPCASSGER